MSEHDKYNIADPSAEELHVEGPLDEEEVLDARQAARLLTISTDLLYESANRGEVPHRRIGRRMVFSKIALLSLLRDGEPFDGRHGRRSDPGPDIRLT